MRRFVHHFNAFALHSYQYMRYNRGKNNSRMTDFLSLWLLYKMHSPFNKTNAMQNTWKMDGKDWRLLINQNRATLLVIFSRINNNPNFYESINDPKNNEWFIALVYENIRKSIKCQLHRFMNWLSRSVSLKIMSNRNIPLWKRHSSRNEGQIVQMRRKKKIIDHIFLTIQYIVEFLLPSHNKWPTAEIMK